MDSGLTLQLGRATGKRSDAVLRTAMGTRPGMTGVYSSLPNTSLPSIHTHSQFSDYFLIRLDFHPSRTILLPSRFVKRALRGRHEAERDATDPSRLSGPSRGKQSPRSARRGLAGRRPAVGGGRPKDPANAEDRVSVKARCAVGCWGLQAEKSSRAERRRIAASVACCCRVLSKAHGRHVLAHGAAGAVKRPVVPHAPQGKERQEETGEPRAGGERGAMMRVCV
jgi:hypothetical protein